MPGIRSTTATRAVAAAQALDPAQFDEKVVERSRDRRGRLDRLGDPGGARRAVRVPARFRRSAARRGARRARHRHRDLPRRRREDLRRRGAGGARAPPRRRAQGAGQPADEAAILADILRRDERDRLAPSRRSSPRRCARARHDTPDVDAAVAAAIAIVEDAARRDACADQTASKLSTGSGPALRVSSSIEIVCLLRRQRRRRRRGAADDGSEREDRNGRDGEFCHDVPCCCVREDREARLTQGHVRQTDGSKICSDVVNGYFEFRSSWT